MDSVCSKIISGIASVRAGAIQDSFSIARAQDIPDGANEFLFFIKPELLFSNQEDNITKIIDMILAKLNSFGLTVISGRVLSAHYLKKYGIIAQHYGVINQLSSDAKAHLSADARERFAALYGKTVDDCNIFGSIEFIDNYPSFSPTALDYMWQNGPMEKLAGGTYTEKLKIDGQEVYLVNGFHPRQLEHFVLPGRMIVALRLVGRTTWAEARGKLIGSTNPAYAAPGSIRRTLYEGVAEFGLQAITSSWNGVHLSAGPVEGLVELMRFTTDFENGQASRYDQFSFGRKLESGFGETLIQSILENCQVSFGGKQISVFDLTEELDAAEAIATLQKVEFTRP